ncbi:MAG: thioredoxin family protein [Acidobacteria bacterium]|nr:thioredoxin family protein [Acidobacteriota bacterium]
MVLTPSTMLALGTRAPDFTLPDALGNRVALAEFAGAPATVIVFLCNHCPYVKHLKTALAEFAQEYQAREVAVIGINSNDAAAHPEDGPEAMARDVAEFGYGFPYLIDATQEVAKAYRAACTPDFFVFDAALRLAYRGQFDDSRPENDTAVTGRDLRAAVDTVAAGQRPTGDQRPSIGCNIKWKPGNEPDYFA